MGNCAKNVKLREGKTHTVTLSRGAAADMFLLLSTEVEGSEAQ
jgi:hypothetical protein